MFEQRIVRDGRCEKPTVSKYGTSGMRNGGYVQLNTFLCHERVYQQDDRFAVENEQDDHRENVAFQQQLDQSRCRIDGFFEPRYRPQSIFGFEPQRFAQQQSRRSQSVHEEIDRFHRNRSM